MFGKVAAIVITYLLNGYRCML